MDHKIRVRGANVKNQVITRHYNSSIFENFHEDKITQNLYSSLYSSLNYCFADLVLCILCSSIYKCLVCGMKLCNKLFNNFYGHICWRFFLRLTFVFFHASLRYHNTISFHTFFWLLAYYICCT